MAAPAKSIRGAPGSADSGTKRSVAIRAIAARTTLRPNTDCQWNHSSSTPELSRPSTALPPATAAHTLTARVRRSGGNVPVMVESVAGMTSEAPSPRIPRSTISSPADPAGMARAEPAPKMLRPAISAVRRP